MSLLQKFFGRNPEAENSLHGEMFRLDIVEEVLSDVVKAYQSLIDLMVTHIPKAACDVGLDQKKRLKQIRNLLDSRPSRPLIREVREQLEKTVTGFAQTLDQLLGQQEKETRQLLAIVAVTADSMADREKSYNVRFRGIGQKLRLLTTSNDIAEIRFKLEAEVARLERYVEEMSRDTESAISRVQSEVRQARQQEPVPLPVLPTPEIDGTVPLKAKTIAGRREAEQAIEARRRLDARFCAARFCIDNLQNVAAQFGRPAAAKLMDQAGELIRQRFEEADLICRWSDSDLIVITDLLLPEVAMRVGELESQLAGPYPSGSRELTLAVRSCVIERGHGERGQKTIGRIDSMIVPAGSRQ